MNCLLSKFRFYSILLKTAKTKLAAKGIILESSLEFMSQMFLELQPKIKNCLLEEYNQKAFVRIAISQILLQLQKKHNVMAGNIKKLSFELLSQF